MERLKQLVRPHILDLKPYSSARDDYHGDASVWIDANENPHGAIPTGDYNRYPDPHQRLLKEGLSKIKKVKTEQIFLGNGSDEPIDLLIRAFCTPDMDEVIIMPPTYGMFRVSANINQVKVIEAPLTREFQIDFEEVRQKITNKTKIIFVCSPNNPTGNLLNRETILQITKNFPGLVVVDEAYIDFAGTPSFLQELEKYPNLVIFQTFSKAWGLAALRLGAAYAHPFLVGILDKIKPPYNINKLTQEAGLKALDNLEKKDLVVHDILNERLRLRNEIMQLESVVKAHPSDANFLLIEFNAAEKVNSYLRNLGIIVRDRSRELHCEGCLRITIGTKEENDRLISALKNMP